MTATEITDRAAEARIASAEPTEVAALIAMGKLALLDHIEAVADREERASRRRDYDTVSWARTHGALAAAVYRMRVAA